MAGTQRQNSTFAHRLGYGLGQLLKRVRTAWAAFERKLVQRAGNRGQLMKVSLLLFKFALVIAAVIVGLFALYWLAIAVGVIAAIAFSSGAEQDKNTFSSSGFTGYGDMGDGEGYYVDGYRVE